jgi:hypothetical protein
MRAARKRRRPSSNSALAAGFLALVLVLAPAGAQAAAAPLIHEVWTSQVFSSTARLQARVSPNGLPATYHFDYVTRSQYEANGNGFSGAQRVPLLSDANFGSGTSPVGVLQQIGNLQPDTAYRYRIVAKNSSGTVTGEALSFITRASGAAAALADNRVWEMVSPVEKNGGQVAAPGSLSGGGVLQGAAQGGSITYGSAASFAGGQGAPPASQYLATRTSGGWTTENITQPLFSGSYDAGEGGGPYRIFSADLARAILLNGDHCRGEGSGCAVANPPLAGTEAPAGYQNYYLREGDSFTALLADANAGFLTLEPRAFDLTLAGSSPDLRHPVVATCAALTANATEVPLGEGCDPAKQNLYLYSAGSGLSLLNVKPGGTSGIPGASLAAQSAAVSEDGSRVYFSLEGNLYLRAAGQTKQADADAGGGGVFQTASADGSVAYFSKEGHLWRYLAATDAATDITPAGEVQGVLGASAGAAVVYFQDAVALKRWSNGTTSTIAGGAAAAEETNWPPTTGVAHLSADGSKLLFTSTEPLTEYDNTDLSSGEADSQVFLYDATGTGTLTCVSCNPTLSRPLGPSTVPGSTANGSAPDSTDTYKPRVLSANGRRVFFDSEDAQALTDTNGAPDAYQWEAQGEGSCTRPDGCISLISDGRSAGGATFVDSSLDGADAFFLTAGSLLKDDPGGLDLYDARAGGGFPEPPPAILCEADACQPLPSPPADPTLTTLLAGPGNPPVRFPKSGCPKGKVKRRGKCVKKGSAHKPKAGKQGKRSAR